MITEKEIAIITISLVAGIFIGALLSKETMIYKQPDLLTEQSRVLENCMQGYDRTLKLLGEANGLLDKLTQ
jgi:hypothetical protein